MCDVGIYVYSVIKINCQTWQTWFNQRLELDPVIGEGERLRVEVAEQLVMLPKTGCIVALVVVVDVVARALHIDNSCFLVRRYSAVRNFASVIIGKNLVAIVSFLPGDELRVLDDVVPPPVDERTVPHQIRQRDVGKDQLHQFDRENVEKTNL